MPPDLVEVDGVWKNYGDRVALRGVHFALRSGEAVGYLGPNGAGKSTTLKLLAGISRPTRGSLRIRGVDPSTDRVRALQRTGALVETPAVPAYVTGSDLLEFVARVRGVASAERRAAVRHAAEVTGVVETLDRPYGALSTGVARRVLLAAALVGDPELLLLDEPTLGLDPAAREDLRRMLRQLAKNGLTLLLSTHLLEDIESVCDRVLFLRDGLLVGDEPVRPETPEVGGAESRRLALRFGADVSEASLRAALGPEAELTLLGPREALVRFGGGDRAQGELLARVIRADLPLLTASPPASDLARRYLERIGREEAT